MTLPDPRQAAGAAVEAPRDAYRARSLRASPLVLGALSGVLVGTSFIPCPPWAVLFCFVPLWLAWLGAKSWREIVLSGCAAQIVLTCIGFNWIAATIHSFLHWPWSLAIPGQLVFAGISNLYLPVSGVVWWSLVRVLRPGLVGQIILLPALMAICGRLVPTIFDWNFGYVWLWAGFPIFQLADIVGFVGLHDIGLALNALFLASVLNLNRGKPARLLFAAPVILFALLNLLGLIHARSRIETTDGMLRALVVQPNISSMQTASADLGISGTTRIVEKFARLTESGLAGNTKVDLAIWPETAIPWVMADPGMTTGLSALLRDWLARQDITLITGGYSRLADSERNTNAVFVLGARGWLAAPYNKTILLAFGEYFPGAELWPGLATQFPEIGNFGRGEGPIVFNVKGVRIGAQICYEGLFDWFSAELAAKGAQVIVNITNDSWFGGWWEQEQHGYMSLARAIEIRRPLVRVTNTGLSAVISASGVVEQIAPLGRETAAIVDVPYATDPASTIFMGWGRWLMPALTALTLLVTGAHALTGRYGPSLMGGRGNRTEP